MTAKTALALTRHQSLAVVFLMNSATTTEGGRALHTRLARLAGESHRINLGPKQIALLAGVCMTHLRECDGCLADEAAAQILTDLTPSPEREGSIDLAARAEVGQIYRIKMLTLNRKAPVADLIVKVRAAYASDRDPHPYSHGECVDLDILSGGYTRAHAVQLQLSTTTDRSYSLHPIALPTV